MTKTKIVEKNEFGIKKSNNRLCLLCIKYITNKGWKKHLKKCEQGYKW